MNIFSLNNFFFFSFFYFSVETWGPTLCVVRNKYSAGSS